MGFTDDCYTDERDPSVTPSVLFLPTECIDVTDGISPSAKLYNVVVYILTIQVPLLQIHGSLYAKQRNDFMEKRVSWELTVDFVGTLVSGQ